jgi:hypothetical protein
MRIRNGLNMLIRKSLVRTSPGATSALIVCIKR